MQNDNKSLQEAEMSPFIPSTSIKYDVISPSCTNTTILISTESISRFKHKADTSDDEISVGCPSPVNMSPKQSQGACNNTRNKEDKILLSTAKSSLPEAKMGVKSFSIMEILNHRPRPVPCTANSSTMTKIVRPWDSCENDLQNQLKTDTSSWSLAEQITFLRRAEIAAAHAFSSSYTSETGSDRSSSVTSECCSPDNNNSIHYQQSQKQRLQNRSKGSLESTPLDALFQMTSKTFDSNSHEVNSDGQNMNLFNNRQQPKKKRKSRTAFTNHQIFELEKRFLYQKYLSPADRDEIAASLGLSNAQVITWFQNRRAKLKRDMEELKKDVESAKILTAHKTFLENVQDLNTLKKKALLSVNDCPKV